MGMVRPAGCERIPESIHYSLWGRRMNWKTALRIVAKAAILFVTLNLLFAWLNPLEALGRLSLYNVILPGRERLPYGENPAEPYNLSLYNIPAMFASHIVSRPQARGEFGVLRIGDAGTCGCRQESDDTLAEQFNAASHGVNGKRGVVYNLGDPIRAMMKAGLLLDAAMQYPPEMIVWSVTL